VQGRDLERRDDAVAAYAGLTGGAATRAAGTDTLGPTDA
jgi:hypothetical protein